MKGRGEGRRFLGPYVAGSYYLVNLGLFRKAVSEYRRPNGRGSEIAAITSSLDVFAPFPLER